MEESITNMKTTKDFTKPITVAQIKDTVSDNIDQPAILVDYKDVCFTDTTSQTITQLMTQNKQNRKKEVLYYRLRQIKGTQNATEEILGQEYKVGELRSPTSKQPIKKTTETDEIMDALHNPYLIGAKNPNETMGGRYRKPTQTALDIGINQPNRQAALLKAMMSLGEEV